MAKKSKPKFRKKVGASAPKKRSVPRRSRKSNRGAKHGQDTLLNVDESGLVDGVSAGPIDESLGDWPNSHKLLVAKFFSQYCGKGNIIAIDSNSQEAAEGKGRGLKLKNIGTTFVKWS
jgi:hypothetical protein